MIYIYLPELKGAVGELRVAADLLLRGWSVYRSVSPSAPCDLVGIWNGKCRRFEVRTGQYLASGAITCPKPEEGKFDILAIVTDDRIVYEPSID